MSGHNRQERGAKRQRGNRRRKYVVDAAFQWKYILTITAGVFVVSATMSSGLYGLLHHQARLRSINPETYSTEVTSVIILCALAFSVVTAIAVGIWCLIATHRICGPLFVLERYLVELSKGRIPRPRALRRKDEFKGLYETFSRATDSLRERKQAELTELSDMLAAAKAAAGADDDDRKLALESICNHLEWLRNAVRESLGVEPEEGAGAAAASFSSTNSMPVPVAQPSS